MHLLSQREPPRARSGTQSKPGMSGSPSAGDAGDAGEARVSTAALLFATTPAADGGPAAILAVPGSTVLGRLLDQLESLGVHRIWLVTRPDWKSVVEAAASGSSAEVTVVAADDVSDDLRVTVEIAGRAHGPLLLGSAHVLAHEQALAGLLADPRVTSGVLATGSRARGSWSFPIRSVRGRIVSASSPYHSVGRANGYFLSLVKVDLRDRDSLVAASRRLAELAVEPHPAKWDEELGRKAGEWRLRLWRARTSDRTYPPVSDVLPLDSAAEAELALRLRAASQDAVALLVVGLVRADVHLSLSYLRGFFHAMPLSADSANVAVDQMSRFDEDRVLLDSAVKGNDSFFTTFFVSPYSKYLARFAARRGWSPNALTTVSLGIGMAAAASFAAGNRLGLIAGAVLLQVAFTVDCVDGQLARYTRSYSKLGAWLDSVFDRLKEYLVYGGLAIGAARGFEEDVWILAAAALTLQTVRHLLDFSYSAREHEAIRSTPASPLEDPADARPGPAGAAPAQSVAHPLFSTLARRVTAAATAVRRHAWGEWSHRILLLPIGERFALISLTAAIATPRSTFVALLAWGGLAAIYTATGRILRGAAE